MDTNEFHDEDLSLDFMADLAAFGAPAEIYEYHDNDFDYVAWVTEFSAGKSHGVKLALQKLLDVLRPGVKEFRIGVALNRTQRHPNFFVHLFTCRFLLAAYFGTVPKGQVINCFDTEELSFPLAIMLSERSEALLSEEEWKLIDGLIISISPPNRKRIWQGIYDAFAPGADYDSRTLSQFLLRCFGQVFPPEMAEYLEHPNDRHPLELLSRQLAPYAVQRTAQYTSSEYPFGRMELEYKDFFERWAHELGERMKAHLERSYGTFLEVLKLLLGSPGYPHHDILDNAYEYLDSLQVVPPALNDTPDKSEMAQFKQKAVEGRQDRYRDDYGMCKDDLFQLLKRLFDEAKADNSRLSNDGAAKKIAKEYIPPKHCKGISKHTVLRAAGLKK